LVHGEKSDSYSKTKTNIATVGVPVQAAALFPLPLLQTCVCWTCSVGHFHCQHC